MEPKQFVWPRALQSDGAPIRLFDTLAASVMLKRKIFRAHQRGEEALNRARGSGTTMLSS